MNRKAYEERLRSIKLSEFDSQVYEGYASQVRKQIQSLKNIINSLIGEELCREKGYAAATNAMVVAIYIDA